MADASRTTSPAVAARPLRRRLAAAGAVMVVLSAGGVSWWTSGTGPDEVDGIVLLRADRTFGARAVGGFGFEGQLTLVADRCVGVRAGSQQVLAIFPVGATLTVQRARPGAERTARVSYEGRSLEIGETYEGGAERVPVPGGVPSACRTDEVWRLD